jgi:hypothetical protein
MFATDVRSTIECDSAIGSPGSSSRGELFLQEFHQPPMFFNRSLNISSKHVTHQLAAPSLRAGLISGSLIHQLTTHFVTVTKLLWHHRPEHTPTSPPMWG